MKKLTFILFVLLAGCAAPSAPQPAAVPEPEPTPSALPEISAEPTEEPVAYEQIEAVLEEELPMSLKVTIQDLEAVFTKDLNYHCEDELQVSDYIVISYTGEIDRNPIAISAEKKK